MIEAPAEVVRVAPGRVWVRLAAQAGGCGRCDEPGGCRSMKITQAFGGTDRLFALPDRLGLQPGERVRITMADGAPLGAALASYGLGAACAVLGALTGAALVSGASDAAAAAGALAGLALAYGANRVLMRSQHWRARLAMEVRRDDGHCVRRGGEG